MSYLKVKRYLARGISLCATVLAIQSVQAQSTDFTQVVLDKVKQHCPLKHGDTPERVITDDESRQLDDSLQPYVHLHNAHLLLDSAQLDKAYLETVAGVKALAEDERLQLILLMQARIQIAKGLYREASDSYAHYLKVQSAITNDLVETVKSSLGTLYLVLEDYTAALALFKASLAQIQQGAEKQYARLVYHNLGLTHLHLKQLDSAQVYLNKSIELEKQSDDTVGLAISYMDIANLYYEQYLDDKAIPFFELGLKTANLSGNAEAMLSANKNMAVVEENRKNFQQALIYRKTYEQLQDSLWNRDRVWELAEQEKQYELSLKQSRIQLLEEQENAQKATLAARNWQRNSLLITSLALLVFMGFLYWANRFLKRKNHVISTQKQQLEDLDQQKNRLYGIVAHDLRSPLLALQRSNQHIADSLDQADTSTQAREALADNMVATQRTYKLLDNLLHWSLDQSKQWSMQPEQHHITTLVDQVLYDYEALIKQKAIDLHLELGAEHLACFDINSLKIVLRNLLDNALKHTPQNGTLRIESTEAEGMLELSLSDNGSGIDPERLAMIFSLSREKVKEDMEGNTGTGLGLPLCKSLIERNQGSFDMESSPGLGTRAVIRLPLKAPVNG